MAEKNDYSTTDASNTARWPEAMARAAVNNAARANEGIEARHYKDNNGSLVTAGSSTVYTITLNSQHAAWFTGLTFRAKLDETCGAVPTINPTGSAALGAKNLFFPDGTQVTTGHLIAGGMYDFVYDGTNVQVASVGASPLAAASTTVAGKVEFGTVAEHVTGASTTLAATLQGVAVTTGRNGPALVNGYLTASAAAGALTLALKTLAGTDPSATDPVLCVISDETITTGLPDVVTRTAATSLVVPSTATLGVVTNIAAALYVVLNNDGQIGVVNARSGINVMALDEGALYSSTAISTGADSAQVFYTTSGTTNKPFRVIAKLMWAAGTLSAGTWSDHTRIEQAFSGMKLPGAVIQSRRTQTGEVATGTDVTVLDDTVPLVSEGTEFMAVTIIPRSPANLLKVKVTAHFASSANVSIIGHIHQDDATDAIAASIIRETSVNLLYDSITIEHVLLAADTISTEFQFLAGPTGAATISFNGEAGARMLGGFLNSYIAVEEIVA